MTREDVVAFIQPYVPSYRVGLFNSIERHLNKHGLRLEVWHDDATGIAAARGNDTSGPWSVPIKQHRLTVRQRNVTYRNVRRSAREVRAVVHGLASSNLETYGLARDPGVQLMLWGHGRNFTSAGNRLDDRLEGWLCRRARHLFAYTEAGAQHLTSAGIEPSKITVVRNSTDTELLRRHQLESTSAEVDALRNRLDLGGKRVVLFVGAYDKPKRLPFLIESVDLMHEADPSLVLLMAGAGPLDRYVADAAAERKYVTNIGRLDAAALARLSHLTDLLLMPGRVGLVAVDSLALGIPLATTRHAFHAPEIEYLTEETSLWSDDDPAAYADAVTALLDDSDRRSAMVRESLSAGAELSTDRAGQRFVSGILRGLA